MTQHCQMCDGTQADCTPCPGVKCAECVEKEEEKWSLARLLDKRNHECQQAQVEIARLRALVAVGREMEPYCRHNLSSIANRLACRWRIMDTEAP